MWVDNLPAPLTYRLKHIVFSLRVPFNRLRAVYNTLARKWHGLSSRDRTVWKTVDLNGPDAYRLCISLLNRPEFEPRRRLFREYAERFGWRVDFWPAVNGLSLHPDEYKDWIADIQPDEQRPFTPGAIGLLTTTKNIYQWALERSFEYVVVLEDDGVIHASPKVELPQEFDVVFFNNRVQGNLRGEVKHGWGTDGYVISRRGMAKMLDILENVNADIDLLMMMYTRSLEERGHHMPQYRDRSKPQLECYHVGPLVTHAGYLPSSISSVSSEAENAAPASSCVPE